MTQSQREPRRILLVDDLNLFRRTLPARLGTLGACVDAVANVEEARAYLARGIPDLILLDVVMPGVDGFTYCRELKAEHRTRGIAVIMLTDLTTNARDRSLEAGADDYMPKRLDDSVMRIRVGLHLNLVELRRGDPDQPFVPGRASVVLATASPSLKAQFSAQYAMDGHVTRVLDTLEDLPALLRAEDNLLVVDLDLGLEAIHEALTLLRMDPATDKLPVLVLGSRDQFTGLQDIEAMVDDVLWKPLKAEVSRQRLAYLLELGQRTSKGAVTG